MMMKANDYRQALLDLFSKPQPRTIVEVELYMKQILETMAKWQAALEWEADSPPNKH